jgi:hypothetical protein
MLPIVPTRRPQPGTIRVPPGTQVPPGYAPVPSTAGYYEPAVPGVNVPDPNNPVAAPVLPSNPGGFWNWITGGEAARGRELDQQVNLRRAQEGLDPLPESPSAWSEFWGAVGDGFNHGSESFWRGMGNAGRSIGYAIFHPAETLGNLIQFEVNFYRDPVGTTGAIWNNLVDAWNRDPSELMGQVAGNALFAAGTMGSSASLPTVTIGAGGGAPVVGLAGVGGEVAGAAGAAAQVTINAGLVVEGAAAVEMVGAAVANVAPNGGGQRPAPAEDNYRGRYQADLHEQDLERLPDDWDVHHRIPQEYMDHPEFADFDFHDPSNLQGVRGSRSDVNVHQDITNRWAEFRRQNPNAGRAQIEEFAAQIDDEFAAEWWTGE